MASRTRVENEGGNAMKITNIEVNGDVFELPQKTSDLENDKEFQTKEEVVDLINKAIGEIENGTY